MQSKQTFDIYDVLAAECTLEPMVCIHCGSCEVTYDQHICDAYCASCGKWQLDDRKGERS